jgi:DNA-binding CsgD family transcriptional regulator
MSNEDSNASDERNIDSAIESRVDFALADIARTARNLKTVEDFKEWARTKIRPVFPHRALVCGYGRLYAAGVVPDYCVLVDFPVEYLHKMRNPMGIIDTPIMRRWQATREPQLLEADHPWDELPEEWLRSFRQFGFKNLAAHGLFDTGRCIGTYYSFHTIPGRLGGAHAESLKRLVPVMHEALCRVFGLLDAESRLGARLAGLNEREREIVGWLRLGKTNAEIGNLVHLSENTIKHHVTRIFDKLGMDSRAQLMHQLAEYEAQTALALRTRFI